MSWLLGSGWFWTASSSRQRLVAGLRVSAGQRLFMYIEGSFSDYIESEFMGHLNDAQTFSLVREIISS